MKRLLPIGLALISGCMAQQTTPLAPAAAPETLDLMSTSGLEKAGGTWSYASAQLVEAEAKSASGEIGKALAVAPVPGSPDWDKAPWEDIGAETLKQPRGSGKVCFAWYRTAVALPPEAEGARVEFECVVDDYAEVWVNGKLDRKVGQKGGSVVAGFNAPNVVVLSESGKAGDRYDVAVFGINGPISASPDNYIFFRTARLLIHK